LGSVKPFDNQLPHAYFMAVYFWNFSYLPIFCACGSIFMIDFIGA
jgi:hypothetical protein